MSDTGLKVLSGKILEEGVDVLGLSLGIVSKVDESSYFIVAVRSDTGVFKEDETFELKDTYCREVFEKKKTIALTQLDNTPGLCKHPLYSVFPLESYISAPIIVADKVWGTLNFSSMIIKKKEFIAKEVELVEKGAKQIADYIVASNLTGWQTEAAQYD